VISIAVAVALVVVVVFVLSLSVRIINAADHRAGIGALCDASALFAGSAGTTIRSHTNKHNAQHPPV